MVELALAGVFLASLLAIGIGAATSASGSALVPFFELCCLFAISLVLLLELVPAVVAFRERRAAVRRFRRQLDALPETPHPLDQAVRRG
ncbi:MAG: hypothetical protein ACLP0L_17565 [Solirubrobacteraceae bacterium]